LTLKSPSLVRPTRPCPVPPMLTFFSLPSLSLSLSPLPNLVLFSQVIAFDKLDYCASLHNLDEIKDKPNFKVSLRGDGKKKRKKKNRRVFRLRRWSKRREREREIVFFPFEAIAGEGGDHPRLQRSLPASASRDLRNAFPFLSCGERGRSSSKREAKSPPSSPSCFFFPSFSAQKRLVAFPRTATTALSFEKKNTQPSSSFLFSLFSSY
jgi:hypothetical protein